MTDENETQGDVMSDWNTPKLFGTFLWAVPRACDPSQEESWPPENARLIATAESHVPDERAAKEEELVRVRERFRRKADYLCGEMLVVGIAHGRHFSLFLWDRDQAEGNDAE